MPDTMPPPADVLRPLVHLRQVAQHLRRPSVRCRHTAGRGRHGGRPFPGVVPRVVLRIHSRHTLGLGLCQFCQLSPWDFPDFCNLGMAGFTCQTTPVRPVVSICCGRIRSRSAR